MIVHSENNVLRFARRAPGCRVLGPGRRGVVWFYGCSRGCPGCIASEMNFSGEFIEESPEELYHWVKSCNGIEGVTLSGGEPMEQPTVAMERFLQLLRGDERHLGVICFTGYRLGELQKSEKSCLLPYIDVLVDGPYVETLNDGKGLRGSSNQEIHFLTPRYTVCQDFFYSAEARNLEFELQGENNLVMNGIPERNFSSRFADELKKRGYQLSFNNGRKDK